MKKYNVYIKEVYIYEDVPANNKLEAIQKVLDMEWRECDNQLETEAKLK